jgi:hypothetical protein
MSEFKSAADIARDTIEIMDRKYGTPVLEAKARLDELEQRVARRGGDSEPSPARAGAHSSPQPPS